MCKVYEEIGEMKAEVYALQERVFKMKSAACSRRVAVKCEGAAMDLGSVAARLNSALKEMEKVMRAVQCSERK